MLDAWRRHRDLPPLIIAGDGPELPAVVDATTDARIRYVGFQTSEQVRSLMRDAAALVFPSMWFEGMPLTLRITGLWHTGSRLATGWSPRHRPGRSLRHPSGFRRFRGVGRRGHRHLARHDPANAARGRSQGTVNEHLFSGDVNHRQLMEIYRQVTVRAHGPHANG